MKRNVLLALVILLLSAAARAEGLALPPGLTALDAEAFRDCPSVREVTIPASVGTIGADCFAGCGEALWIHCEPDSAAHRYALENGIDYDADTQCRALVIGQTYTGTSSVLYGPAEDARAMRLCLLSLERQRYAVTPRADLTAAGLLEAIGSAFAQADETDISLLFYSGHGQPGGSLVGSDLKAVSPAALRAALDAVPGRKIVVVDACYSGALVDGTGAALRSGAPASGQTGAADDFNADFLAGFFPPARRGASGASDAYYVLTSAQSDEESWESLIPSGGSRLRMGFFSYSLCLGCGWDAVAGTAVAPAADANADGVVSLAEAFAFARDKARALARSANVDQNARSNAADCAAFSPFR